ncbi:MAG: hypothetical protein CMP83_08405 [Gammaproteobacteria bacterium]|nr:hypothetical protein [Gammaproteobacteria bacterium]
MLRPRLHHCDEPHVIDRVRPGKKADMLLSAWLEYFTRRPTKDAEAASCDSPERKLPRRMPADNQHEALSKAVALPDVHPLLQLPDEMVVAVLEKLPFGTLIAARGACTRLCTMALLVTHVVLNRKQLLSLPLLEPFGAALLWLELRSVASDWLPRLGYCLAVLPRLQRLSIYRTKSTNPLNFSLAETAPLAINGALQAGACQSLHQIDIERLPKQKVRLIAWAMQPNGGLLFGASHGYESVIDKMLRRGASSEDAVRNDGGARPSSLPAPPPRMPTVRSRVGALVRVCVLAAATALILACWYGDAPGNAPVKRLLAHGANVCARRHDGLSALTMAATRGHTQTVEALLDAKADVNMAMRDGTTALHTATDEGHTQVVAVLIAAGAMLQARCHDGDFALLKATRSGRDDLVRMLLHAKAEVDAAVRNGQTPLVVAAYKGHDGCVEALLAAKARVDAGWDGLTPLYQASHEGHVRCVEMLLESKANVESAGAVYGSTSLLVASGGGHTTIVEMLLRHNADTVCAPPATAPSPRPKPKTQCGPRLTRP